ncbi:MAG: hypothetical protein EOO74_06945, partial [Myxococcales bacterium]
MKTTLVPVAVALLLAAMTQVSPAHAASVCYQLPFGNPNLSDGWGSTCCGRTNPHRGVDFPQAKGTKIPAVADGVVRRNEFNGCLGNSLVIEHADGMFSGYAHLVGASPLPIGATVKRGDTIGHVGSTGTCTTGPHLHLTIAPGVDGFKSGTTVDPYAYIQGHLTCTPDLAADFIGQSSDAPADPSGQAYFSLCAGAPVTLSFEVRNTGARSWVDWGDDGNDWGQRVRLGHTNDQADPLDTPGRVSLAGSSNPDVHPASGSNDCNDKALCSRTVFTIPGKAPATPGIYTSHWKLVDDGRAWFGPDMSLS